jgi:hypothetical protein
LTGLRRLEAPFDQCQRGFFIAGAWAELLALSPVWATGRWFENSNHVYVIVGVSENEVEYYDPWYDVAPDDAFTSHKTSLNWVLNGDGGTRKGLAHTFQWYPLQFIKP